MDIEYYIKDLSPELQEKARNCKTTDELLALAQDENVALPNEALAAIAGGDDEDSVGGYDKCGILCCDACGSKKVSSKVDHAYTSRTVWACVCKKCGYRFHTDGMNAWPDE